MLDVLIAGRLAKPPERRTAKNGKDYATAQLIVATDGGESFLASLIVFSEIAINELLALDKGDAVAVAGRAKPSAWQGSKGELKAGLSVTVERVLTAYLLRRKRAAVQGDDAPAPAPQPRQPAPRKPLAALAPANFDPADDGQPFTAGLVDDPI